MRKFAKFLFYFISLALLVTASFYGGAYFGGGLDSGLLRVVGIQNLQAQNLGGDRSDLSRFGLLFDALRHLKRSYVEEITDDDYTEIVYGSIRGMLRALGDDYTRFMDPDSYKNMTIDTEGKFGGVGIYIEIKNGQLHVNSPLEDTPASKVGLKAGDLILKIDGVSTEDMALEDAVARIRGDAGDPVVLTIWRAGWMEGKDITIVRDIIKLKSTEKMKMLEDEIGYVRLLNFSKRSHPVLKSFLLDLKKQKAKGLILDLRGNPGGLLDEAVSVSNLFIDEGPIVHRVSRNEKTETRNASPGEKVWDGPMAVLVNKYSASASEIVAGALQDNGVAAIIGEQSFGKGLVQTVFQLADGSAILVTTDKYYTSKMRDINKKGITPDIIVKIDPRTGHAVEVKEEDDREIGRKRKIKKFPLEELRERIRTDESLKNAGILVYNGFPREDVFYYNIDGGQYIEANDVGILMGAKVDLDGENRVLELDTESITGEERDEEINDAQVQRAIQYLKRVIAGEKIDFSKENDLIADEGTEPDDTDTEEETETEKAEEEMEPVVR
ncbi:MAG: S41 family peptidase [bacterium]